MASKDDLPLTPSLTSICQPTPTVAEGGARRQHTQLRDAPPSAGRIEDPRDLGSSHGPNNVDT
ncbi:Hypothetical predicted protein [Lynx pardinus]|uniref:Uncharacterized protein n=1 Tax=Lynx pardinus TaxID=191816 RepID=A0A485N1R1_LYNPA|nr:Hypothetical predicted protein [Lynx pardinus]